MTGSKKPSYSLALFLTPVSFTLSYCRYIYIYVPVSLFFSSLSLSFLQRPEATILLMDIPCHFCVSANHHFYSGFVLVDTSWFCVFQPIDVSATALRVSLSVCLSVCLCLCLSVCLCVSVCLSVCLSASVSLRVDTICFCGVQLIAVSTTALCQWTRLISVCFQPIVDSTTSLSKWTRLVSVCFSASRCFYNSSLSMDTPCLCVLFSQSLFLQQLSLNGHALSLCVFSQSLFLHRLSLNGHALSLCFFQPIVVPTSALSQWTRLVSVCFQPIVASTTVLSQWTRLVSVCFSANRCFYNCSLSMDTPCLRVLFSQSLFLQQLSLNGHALSLCAFQPVVVSTTALSQWTRLVSVCFQPIVVSTSALSQWTRLVSVFFSANRCSYIGSLSMDTPCLCVFSANRCFYNGSLSMDTPCLCVFFSQSLLLQLLSLNGHALSPCAFQPVVVSTTALSQWTRLVSVCFSASRCFYNSSLSMDTPCLCVFSANRCFYIGSLSMDTPCLCVFFSQSLFLHRLSLNGHALSLCVFSQSLIPQRVSQSGHALSLCAFQPVVVSTTALSQWTRLVSVCFSASRCFYNSSLSMDTPCLCVFSANRCFYIGSLSMDTPCLCVFFSQSLFLHRLSLNGHALSLCVFSQSLLLQRFSLNGHALSLCVFQPIAASTTALSQWTRLVSVCFSASRCFYNSSLSMDTPCLCVLFSQSLFLQQLSLNGHALSLCVFSQSLFLHRLSLNGHALSLCVFQPIVVSTSALSQWTRLVSVCFQPIVASTTVLSQWTRLVSVCFSANRCFYNCSLSMDTPCLRVFLSQSLFLRRFSLNGHALSLCVFQPIAASTTTLSQWTRLVSVCFSANRCFYNDSLSMDTPCLCVFSANRCFYNGSLNGHALSLCVFSQSLLLQRLSLNGHALSLCVFSQSLFLQRLSLSGHALSLCVFSQSLLLQRPEAPVHGHHPADEGGDAVPGMELSASPRASLHAQRLPRRPLPGELLPHHRRLLQPLVLQPELPEAVGLLQHHQLW